jgi:hypothetical protein
MHPYTILDIVPKRWESFFLGRKKCGHFFEVCGQFVGVWGIFNFKKLIFNAKSILGSLPTLENWKKEAEKKGKKKC